MSSEIKLHSNFKNTQTPLSNRFIDEFMTSANGEYVKIYIYLLRQMYNRQSADLSLGAIADHFDCHEKDIRRALAYWEKSNLLHMEYDSDHQIESIQLLDCPESFSDSSKEERKNFSPSSMEQTLVQKKAINEAAAQVLPGVSRTISDISQFYTPEQLLSFSEQDNTRELFTIVQQYTGKTLNNRDMRLLLFWMDELKFSNELIYYLIDYCITRHHNNMNYMNKVAINWAENGVSSVEDARRYCENYNELTTAVMRAFGLSGRTLGEKELSYLTKWSRKYHFSKELISEACNRTLLATHQASFEYTDSILTSWYKKGVKQSNDLAPLDAQHQKRTAKKEDSPSSKKPVSNNRFNNFHQRNYNDDALEATLTSL